MSYGRFEISTNFDTHILLYILLTFISSIYLGYHTWRQLLFGSFIGCASGGVWFCLVHWILTPIFPWITSLYMQNCNILQLFAKTQILFHI